VKLWQDIRIVKEAQTLRERTLPDLIKSFHLLRRTLKWNVFRQGGLCNEFRFLIIS
jgi:hypothetical protein